MERSPCVYIMAGKSGVLYTGVTSDLSRRVMEHKLGRYAGFTSKYKLTKLVWLEPHATMLSAIAREKQIKGWSRGKKTALIEERNPYWLDLAEQDGRREIPRSADSARNDESQ